MHKGFTPLEKMISSPVNSRSNSLTGFTLIEVMVSVSIFALVMTLSLGALLAMSESNRKVETMKSVINTLNFALDSMSRSIRTGRLYEYGAAVPPSGSPTPASCEVTPSTRLAFKNADNKVVAYCRGTVPTGGGNPSCSPTGSAILRFEEGGSLAPVTSKEVVIEALDFFVVGAPAGDSIQPKVTIVLSGYVVTSGAAASLADCSTNKATCSTFALQTSATQRIYDQ